MNSINTITVLLVLTLLSSCSNNSISVSVATEKKPWSHLDFKNNPENFQFAIVSDRTGGMRKGVFPMALKRLNLLEPEFVITVGDLISANRKTTNENDVHKMWDETEKAYPTWICLFSIWPEITIMDLHC